MIAIHSTKRLRGLIWFGAARAIIGIFLAAALACCIATPATAAENLYRAQTVVTGQGEANRMIGFASCMEDVLIKVSGSRGSRMTAGWRRTKRKQRISSQRSIIATSFPASPNATSRAPAIGHST